MIPVSQSSQSKFRMKQQRTHGFLGVYLDRSHRRTNFTIITNRTKLIPEIIFKSYRSRLNKILKRAKSSYYVNKFNQISDSKMHWSIIKDFFQSSSFLTKLSPSAKYRHDLWTPKRNSTMSQQLLGQSRPRKGIHYPWNQFPIHWLSPESNFSNI